MQASAYQSWHSMLRRCLWKTHKDYPKYGGIGITIHETWYSYKTFLDDMGPRPAGTTLNRKDNALGYFKENCEWATYQVQSANRQKLKNNASGCPGVSWQTKQGKWLVSRSKNYVRHTLYWGLDFFEACCKAKSWENCK